MECSKFLHSARSINNISIETDSRAGFFVGVVHVFHYVFGTSTTFFYNYLVCEMVTMQVWLIFPFSSKSGLELFTVVACIVWLYGVAVSCLPKRPF